MKSRHEVVGILERQEIGQAGINVTLGEPKQEGTLLETWSILKYGEQMWKTGEKMDVKKKMRENKGKSIIQDVHRNEIRLRLSNVLGRFSDEFKDEVNYAVSEMYIIPQIWEEEHQRKRKMRTEMSMGEKKYKQDSAEQVRTEADKRRGTTMTSQHRQARCGPIISKTNVSVVCRLNLMIYHPDLLLKVT